MYTISTIIYTHAHDPFLTCTPPFAHIHTTLCLTYTPCPPFTRCPPVCFTRMHTMYTLHQHVHTCTQCPHLHLTHSPSLICMPGHAMYILHSHVHHTPSDPVKSLLTLVNSTQLTSIPAELPSSSTQLNSIRVRRSGTIIQYYNVLGEATRKVKIKVT